MRLRYSHFGRFLLCSRLLYTGDLLEAFFPRVNDLGAFYRCRLARKLFDMRRIEKMMNKIADDVKDFLK
jgi:hypothetical protein